MIGRGGKLGMAKQSRESSRSEIDYNITASPLGRLLVAGTARGISAVYLGDKDATLEKELRRDYPTAQLRHRPAAVRQWQRQVVGRLAGHDAGAQLPLDVRGTAFQEQVWKELQKIPYGSKCSYSDISRRMGRPTAVRAVASAIAQNPVSILIPCHRVVRQNGDLGGYRWGISRKRALLEREQSVGAPRSAVRN